MTVQTIETVIKAYSKCWRTKNVLNQIAKLDADRLTREKVEALVEMMYVESSDLDCVPTGTVEEIMCEYYNNGEVGGMNNPDQAIKELCRALL